jgi:serine/threonine protein kinase
MAARAGLLNSYVGDYRLVDFLGAGGMGEVYRAVNTRTGLVAAVKVLTEATDPGLLERFFNEARIQSSIQHKNIARFYEFHRIQDQPCIVMEYIHGQTLAERIKALGWLPASESIYIFKAAVEAVDYIHKLGIVHRDIKANNIKLSSSGDVKLLDFGIAKSQSTSKMTRTGGVVGTLQYLAPEQLKGGVADARADLWALGVILYEMTTGQVPFEADTIGDLYEKIMKVSYAAPNSVNPQVTKEIEAIIGRCLKKKATDRYQTAHALLEDVQRLATSSAAPVSKSPTETVIATTRQHWRPLAAVGAGAALIAILLLYFWGGGPTPTPISTRPTEANASTTPVINKMLQVQLTEGAAQVWRDGNLIGTVSATVPLRFSARVGEKVELVLKQDGYEDLVPARFTVESYWQDSRNVGTFTMRKKK